MLNYEIRKKENVIIYLRDFIVYKFWNNYNLKFYIYNYLFIKKILKENIPIIYKYNFSKNHFIQKRIKNLNNFYDYDYYYIYNKVQLLHESSRVSITSLKSIKTIRHCHYNNDSVNIWDFLITFLKFILKKRPININNHMNEYNKIISLINDNIAHFDSKYISFIHWDLTEKNILLSDWNYYFIDFENSWYFDCYYDYVFLYKKSEELFNKILEKNNIVLNKVRFDVNVMIYDFLNKVYNS